MTQPAEPLTEQIARLTAQVQHLQTQLEAEVAERQIIAQQLASSELQLRAILASMMDAVLTIALDAQGISQIDIAPTHLSQCYSDRQHWLDGIINAFFDPATAEQWRAPIQDCLKQQASIEVDHALQLEGDEHVWLAARITPLDRQCVVWVARDISDRKQAELTLHQKNTQLQATLEQLQRTQSELIAAEKLAVLGQLIANIAHEINTPLGVISSSIRHVQTYVQGAFWQWGDLWQQYTSTQREQLQTLVTQAAQMLPLLSTRERRQRRKHLQQQLQAQKIESAPAIAPLLVDLNQTDLDPLGSFLQQPNALELLKVAYQLSTVQTSITQISSATARAAKIVQALRSYSRQEAQAELTNVDVVETLETVLTLYQNLLKRGIEVVRNYQQPLSMVWGDRDQLHQVWSNLIRNALQAMPDGGTLTLAIAGSTTTVTVQIIDTGTGIAPEVLPQIFEPFFTTRASGEGTGLGLDITRTIVQQHQGQIQVSSQPGNTTFTVELPSVK
ncbi:MAG: hypothetical protein F6J87_06375 [Spirulina sp. SIO3F2]|nr:hypothetical protein [Spirulina sp. SIO3F2]